jgi:hypothetical protein
MASLQTLQPPLQRDYQDPISITVFVNDLRCFNKVFLVRGRDFPPFWRADVLQDNQ